MKFKPQDLLTLLIGLFLLGSCKESNNIGLDLDPNSKIEGTLVDTLSIASRTEKEPRSQATRLQRNPIGYISDPIFGSVESNISMALTIPDIVTNDFTFTSSAVLDSAVLVLGYSKELYADTLASRYRFEIRELAESIIAKDSYFADQVYPTNAQIVGTFYDRIFPTKPLKIYDIVTGGPDTLKTVPAQLRIQLDKNFVKNKIMSLSPTTLSDQRLFSNKFNGFKIELNKSTSVGQLGMVFFDFISSNSKLEVYYRKPNELNANETDTAVVNFPITNGGITPVVSSIARNYTGTPIETQLNNPNTQYAETYVQGLAGVKTKITFPYLNKFRNAVGSVIVNKAELVVPIISGTDVAPFKPLPRIALYKKDVVNKPTQIQDQLYFYNQFMSQELGDFAFGGYFDSTKKQYVFVITNYIQQLLNGQEEDKGTYLAATPLSEFEYLVPSFATSGRSIIGSGAKKADGTYLNPTNRMKLNIFYSKLN